ncbi:MAG TPA: hypothetical protein VFN61_11640 [Acidimicrobiales bacterium]|nr:hypothetical protein [Acidimicrobiales bacterium]
MMTSVIDLLSRWQNTVHVAIWHNALADPNGLPCEICNTHE